MIWYSNDGVKTGLKEPHTHSVQYSDEYGILVSDIQMGTVNVIKNALAYSCTNLFLLSVVLAFSVGVHDSNSENKLLGIVVVEDTVLQKNGNLYFISCHLFQIIWNSA